MLVNVCMLAFMKSHTHKTTWSIAGTRSSLKGDKGRTVHLIDAENLLGSPRFTAQEARQLEIRYRAKIGIADSDQVIVASSHLSAPSLWFGWSPEARRMVRSGRDGADLELVSVVTREHLARRCSNVVIASGDGIFAAVAAQLQKNGCRVSVVCANRASLSTRLALAVRDIHFLDVADMTSTVRKAA